MSSQRQRSKESIRRKRRRIRNQKKEKIRARKALFRPDTDASGCSVTLEQYDKISEQSESIAGEHRFDTDIEEAKQIKAAKAQKEAILRDKYSHYHDGFEDFADDSRPLFCPDNVDRFVQIPVMCQLQDMQKRENRALLSARLYRDQCCNLRRRIQQLEEEKEGVRYFWRNQVLEGQSRGGKMLKLSLEKQ